MPDREKVIKAIEYLNWYFTQDDGIADKDAVKAWEVLSREQEPVKVVRVQNIQTNTYDWGEETEIRTDFFCPDCKEIIASGWTSKFHYCPWCGRPVKWNETN